MKKLMTLALAIVMLATCCSVFAVSADEPTTFWVSHYNDGSVEGAGVIFTTEDTAGAWWIRVAFAPIEGVENAYEITAIADGTPDGSGVPIAIPEGGFVWAANTGNNWPELIANAKGDEWFYNDEHKAKPDYTSPNCNDAMALAATWAVGEQYVITGVDFENIPTSTPDVNWYEDAYVCTATIAPYVAGGDDEPAAPSFDIAKKITAVEGTAVDDNTDEVALDGQIYYFPGNADSERVILSDDYNFRYSYILICDADGTIVEVGNNLVFKSVNDKDFQNEITIPAGGHAFTFFYNADAAPSNVDLLALYNDALSVYSPVTEIYNETIKLDGCPHKLVLDGEYLVANNGKAPSTEPDVPSEEPSTPPQTGDAGLLVFAVLGVVAVLGAAATIKVRG